MKRLMTILFACAASLAGVHSTQAAGRVLVAYFSWGGNTRTVAGQIAELTGADLYEIKPAHAYPTDYNACVEVARAEKNASARPALQGQLPDVSAYDVVLIGFPNWWGTMPMPVFTFVESLDLRGKTVAPFCTHGGGGEQQCFADFGRAARVEVGKGFLRSGSGAGTARPQVERWLRNAGIIQ